MNDQPVRLDVRDGVATITLDRPDAMNSLDVATKEALLAALRQVADDPAVRCVVLTGTGRAFCVGQDLKEHVAILQRNRLVAQQFAVERGPAVDRGDDVTVQPPRDGGNGHTGLADGGDDLLQ